MWAAAAAAAKDLKCEKRVKKRSLSQFQIQNSRGAQFKFPRSIFRRFFREFGGVPVALYKPFPVLYDLHMCGCRAGSNLQLRRKHERATAVNDALKETLTRRCVAVEWHHLIQRPPAACRF